MGTSLNSLLVGLLATWRHLAPEQGLAVCWVILSVGTAKVSGDTWNFLVEFIWLFSAFPLHIAERQWEDLEDY